MATTTLVEFPREAGRNLLNKLTELGTLVTVAFWRFQPDEEAWLLVLSSPDVQTKGPRFLIEEVYDALNSLDDEDRDGLSLRNIVVVSPHLIEIDTMRSRYGTVDQEPDDKWKIYSRSEPYIYRLLPS